MNTHIFHIALFTALAFTLSGADISSSEERIIIISPHWEGIEHEFERAFKEAYEGMEIEWLDVGGTSDILKFVKSEFSQNPDGIGVDLLFGGGTDPFWELARLELLQPYKVPDKILDRVGKTVAGVPVYDPQYRWYGAALAGFGIIYNKKVLDIMKLPEPKAWEDLTDPPLLTWVSSADPRNSGSVHMMYEIILQAYGWDKGWQVITCMGANVRNFVKGSGQTLKEVSTGDAAYGLAIDFYATSTINRVGRDKIGYVMPEGLTVVNPDGIAMLKGAPNPKLAGKFIDFVLSEKGQKIWFYKKGTPGGPMGDQLNRLAVTPKLYDRKKAYNSVYINPFEMKSSLTYDSGRGSERWSILNDLIGVMIIDSHGDLVRAWKSILKDGPPKEESRERLSRMPLSEDELFDLARRKWKDDEFRTRSILEWTLFARKKYREIGGRDSLFYIRYVLPIITITFGAVLVVYLWRLKPTRQ